MSAASLKFAEKLLILREAGNGLLDRLSQTKKVFSDPSQRPTFLADPQFAKVSAALLKKFPDFDATVEKTAGYDILTSKAKVFFDVLEPFYFNFVDTVEFREAAVGVLSEIGSNTVEMKLDENPLLTTAFLDLFTLYAQVNLLANSIEEKKIILAVYYKLFQFVKSAAEPNYTRVSNYVMKFNQPIHAMQEEFRSLSSSLGKTLVTLMPLYTKIRTINLLRKEGALNITLKPEDMARPVADKFHFQMIHANNMHNWIIYGFLLVPETLSLPGAVDLCKFALSEGFVHPICKNTTAQLHEDYDDLFSNYKSKSLNLTKQAKVIKDVWKEAVSKASIQHRQRRIYLRQELNALYRLFTDKPALMAPKFQMLLCALSLAKEEIFWYFRHVRATLPKKMEKKANEEEFKDNRISELIYLVVQFSELINKHRKVIQTYYLEYLYGADRTKLNELCNSTFLASVGPGITQISKSVMEELGNINVEGFKQGSRDYDFKALRLNWFRAESALSSLQSPAPLVKVRDAVDRFNLIVQHTRFVDDIDSLLEEYASLRGLWYWRESFVECYSRAIKDGPNQPLHAMAFLKLLAEFPLNATRYNAEERAEIGNQCVSTAQKLLDELCVRVVALVNEIVKQYITFHGQLEDVNAAFPLLQKRKDNKSQKDIPAPIIPGAESNYRNRPELDRLRLYERNVWQLCSALNEFQTIAIYDQLFCPREFLREKLAENFRMFVRSRAIVEIEDEKQRTVERTIQRPSVLEKHVNVYASVLKIMENFVDLDIDDLLREVFIGEAWIPPLGKSGVMDWINLEETEVKFNGAMIGTYVTWFSEFLSKRLATPGIVYSPARKGFVSKVGMPFRAELYCDIVEFTSLVKLVGPYGIKLIEREILKYVLANVNSIKDHISHNRQALDELVRGYHNETACGEVLRKLKDLDSFLSKSVAIGNALYLRQLLHEALGEVVQTKVPFIYETIDTSFHQYRSNIFMAPELVSIDLLAMDCGIEVGAADQPLKRFLSKAIGSVDAPLMELLPFMYAAAFTAQIWREAQFKPAIDGHSNNAHTLARCINDLIICSKAITTSSGDEKEITNQLRMFVEVSSVILLRMARGWQPLKVEKNASPDVPSMLVFMDKFIEESPLLSRGSLEPCLPYALLRNEYKTLFGKREGGKKEIAGSQDVF